MVLAILAILLTMILVVGIHEAGHALAARMFGVTIKKMSIGFGKPLIQWQARSGINWVWAIWPLGGYVELLNSRISPVETKDHPQCVDKKPVWMRILILLSGAFANFITAWFALILLFSIGITYKLPLIQNIQPDSLAARAGIMNGDQFIKVGKTATPSWHEVGMELISLWGKKAVPITLMQAGKTEKKIVMVDLSQIKFTGKDRSLLTSLGIRPDLSAPSTLMKSSSLLDAIQQANSRFVHILYFFTIVLKQWVTGVIPFSMLLGPLGFFAASVTSLTQGILVFIYFIASLSLAVGFVNLFPIPGLDGGSIVYCLIEKIRGKPISVALEILLYQLMMIVAFLLLIQLVINDLSRYIH